MIYHKSQRQFFSLLQTYTPDDRLKLSLLRGMDKLEKSITLTALPKNYVLSYTLRVFGFSLQSDRRGLLIDKVVKDSPADRIGLRPGDLLAKVDGVETKDLSAFEQLMEDRLGRQSLPFLIVRANRGYLVELP